MLDRDSTLTQRQRWVGTVAMLVALSPCLVVTLPIAWFAMAPVTPEYRVVQRLRSPDELLDALVLSEVEAGEPQGATRVLTVSVVPATAVAQEAELLSRGAVLRLRAARAPDEALRVRWTGIRSLLVGARAGTRPQRRCEVEVSDRSETYRVAVTVRSR